MKFRYGTNKPPTITTKSLLDLIKVQLEDTIIKILIVAAFVSLAVGIWKDGLAEVWIFIL